MSSIIGHTRHLEYFNTVLQRGTLAHAYLFYGPEHVGKFTFARHIAKSFYCRKVIEQETIEKQEHHGSSSHFLPDILERVCGACAECAMIDEGKHPHVILLDAKEHALVSKRETERDISIEDIRELRRRFSYAQGGATPRICIINDAHLMSREASNAFLKLCEEPGACTLFILIAPEKEMLLRTIVSRTYPVYFAPVPRSLANAYLTHENIHEEERAEILGYARGCPGVILQMIRDAAYRKKEHDMARAARALITEKRIPYALRFSERMTEDDALLFRAQAALLSALRDEFLGTIDEKRLAAKNAIKECYRVFSGMDAANVNKRLALDALFLRILLPSTP